MSKCAVPVVEMGCSEARPAARDPGDLPGHLQRCQAPPKPKCSRKAPSTSTGRHLEKKEKRKGKGVLRWLTGLCKCPVASRATEVEGVLQKQEVLQESKEIHTCTLSKPREGLFCWAHVFFQGYAPMNPEAPWGALNKAQGRQGQARQGADGSVEPVSSGPPRC